MTKAQILLVEDDPNLGFAINDGLSQQGYQVTLCKDGDLAARLFGSQSFDVCLLDVMLPSKDGFALAREIRGIDSDIPILFITAKSLPEDKTEGFRTGADDFITKPFRMEELIFRIEVFLKRRQVSFFNSPNGAIFSLGTYTFDYDKLVLHHKSQEKILTQREAEVLKCLCEHKGRLLKREEILTRVWGDDDYFMGRSMDVFISKLRKYLSRDPSIEIKNYHGIGFTLEIINGAR